MTETVTMLPEDKYNKALVDAVHPADWENPTADGVYDMISIGAGAAGLITALGARAIGKKVAIIERNLLGGDCLNVGCVPSKGMIRAAHAAANVRDAGEFGVNVEGYSVDFGAAMERMRRLRSSIAPHDSADRFQNMGIDIYLGDGTFTSRNTIEVGGQTLKFKKACIATGARATAPPIPGLDTVDYLTNETVFSLTELPPTIAIFGAGPIGCELAQSFARFGSEVTLIEAMHGILPSEDADAAEFVKQSLLRDGIKLLCCGKKTTIEPAVGNKKRIILDSHEVSYDITIDHILVAVGRSPNIDGLGLDEAGVSFTKQGVVVDDHLQTSNPAIFAAGDICFPYKFTHAADATARIVVRNAFFGIPGFKAKASKLIMPWATFTDPEIAHVGKYPAELEKAGVTFDTVTVQLSDNDRAILEGDEGVLKVHVKKGNGSILGATLVTRHAGEMISEMTTAMVHGIKLQKMTGVIHPYPTQSEVFKRAGDEYFKTWLFGLRDKILFWK
jgi:pyruvate/2-oxoglutarate dehydrogenase complex dihydrolipoamide dehydrogenase (E3) component